MVVVALAGVSSGLGKVVLDVFLSTPHNHKVVVLSRKTVPELAKRGFDVRIVDYNRVSGLANALQGVHTVISLVGGSGKALEVSQLNLLEAAKQAGVTRFAPSEFGGLDNEGVDLYAGKKRVWNAVVASGLEYTRFACGIFMNIYGTGTPKPPTPGSGYATGQDEALSGVRPWNYIVNVTAGTADYPGDGSAALAITEIHDIGYYTLRGLDFETWPETLSMRGDALIWSELTALFEGVQRRRFLTKDNSVQDLQKLVDEVPSQRFYNQTRIRLAEGWALVPDTLNQAFPDHKPMKMKDFAEKWFGGVDLGEASWGKDASFM